MEPSGCGFGEVWVVEWCEGRKWTWGLELFLSFILTGLQSQLREKRQRMQFFYRLFLGGGEDNLGGFSLLCMGFFPPLRSVVNASLKIFLSLGCSTGCCSLQYFHRENTQRISHQSLFFFPFSFILVYFLIKKWNQLLKGCFEFQKDQWLKWFSLHTLAALCLLPVERLSFNLFFFFLCFSCTAAFLCLCLYVAIVERLLSNNHI